MFRALAKTCIACAYSWTSVGRRQDAGSAALPFIVGYHRVVEDFDRSARHTIPSMLISSTTFEKHIDWLARRFSIISLDDMDQHLENGLHQRRPAAAITFDDGYADVYRNAFPILRRKGIPAATFVVTELIGSRRPQIYDRLFMMLSDRVAKGESPRLVALRLLRSLRLKSRAIENLKPQHDRPYAVMTLLLSRFPQSAVASMVAALESDTAQDASVLDELSPMNWDMIGEMQRNGITVGSHTRTHALLTSEQSSRVSQEVVESKQALERRLNTPVHHFAYPDSRCNPGIVEAVKSAGYKFAYTICQWRDQKAPNLTIPRKVLWERASVNVFGRFSSALMSCHAGGFFDSTSACEHDHSSRNPVGK